MESYSVWSFMTDCFHLAQCFRGLFHCSVCLCFILSYDQIIQFTDITAIYVPIHLLMVIWVVPTFLSIVTRAAVNTHVQIFARTDVSSFPEYIPRSSIAASSSNLYLWELPDCSPKWREHSVCTSIVWEFWSLHVLPNSCWLSRTASLMGMKRRLILALICVSLTANDAEHFFMCLLAICIFFGKKFCFSLCFAIGYLSFSCGFLRVLQIFCVGVFLSNIWFVNIFSYSVGCLFTFLMVSFQTQKFQCWSSPVFFVFSFVICDLLL